MSKSRRILNKNVIKQIRTNQLEMVSTDHSMQIEMLMEHY